MSTENTVDPKDPSSATRADKEALYEELFAGDATDQEPPGEESVDTTDQEPPAEESDDTTEQEPPGEESDDAPEQETLSEESFVGSETDQEPLGVQMSQLDIAPPESASSKEGSSAPTVFVLIAVVAVIAIGLFYATKSDMFAPEIADEPPETQEIAQPETAPPLPETATPKAATPKAATPTSTAKESKEPKEPKEAKVTEEQPAEQPAEQPEESIEFKPEEQQSVLRRISYTELEKLKEIEIEALRNHETASEYYRRGDYANALPLYQKAQSDFENLLSQYKQYAEDEYNNATVIQKNLATIYNAVGDIYRNQKKYAEALSWFNKSMEIRKKVHGEDHPETAAIYNNIALVYNAQGKYALALEWYRKDLAISEKTLGSDHPDTAKTYSNIGMVYFHQGERNNALEWFRKAVAIQEKDQGDKNPNAAMTYNNIGEVYRTQGDYALALPEYIKAYRILQDTFGEEHATTKAVRLNMSRAYEKSNNAKPFDDWLSEEMR